MDAKPFFFNIDERNCFLSPSLFLPTAPTCFSLFPPFICLTLRLFFPVPLSTTFCFTSVPASPQPVRDRAEEEAEHWGVGWGVMGGKCEKRVNPTEKDCLDGKEEVHPRTPRSTTKFSKKEKELRGSL